MFSGELKYLVPKALSELDIRITNKEVVNVCLDWDNFVKFGELYVARADIKTMSFMLSGRVARDAPARPAGRAAAALARGF